MSAEVINMEYKTTFRHRKPLRKFPIGNNSPSPMEFVQTLENWPQGKIPSNGDCSLNQSWTFGTAGNIRVLKGVKEEMEWRVTPLVTINDVPTVFGLMAETVMDKRYNLRSKMLRLPLLKKLYDLVYPTETRPRLDDALSQIKELFLFKDINGQSTEPHWNKVRDINGRSELQALTFFVPTKEQVLKIIFYCIGETIPFTEDIVGICIKHHPGGGHVTLWVSADSSSEPIKEFLCNELAFIGNTSIESMPL